MATKPMPSGRCVRVVLLACGSFNPITNMHLRMLELARDHLQNTGQYRVIGGIVSPVSDQYKKNGLVSVDHRCAMVRLAVQTSNWIRLDTWECDQKQWLTTVKVLRHHLEACNSDAGYNTNSAVATSSAPGKKRKVDCASQDEDVSDGPVIVKLVCGSDVLESFAVPNLWAAEDVEEIVSRFGIVVISRSGNNPYNFIYDSDVLSMNKHNIELVEDWIPNNISATRIRTAVRRGQSIKYLVQDPVIDYIASHGLYTLPPVKPKSAATAADGATEIESESNANNNNNRVISNSIGNFLQQTSPPSNVAVDVDVIYFRSRNDFHAISSAFFDRYFVPSSLRRSFSHTGNRTSCRKFDLPCHDANLPASSAAAATQTTADSPPTDHVTSEASAQASTATATGEVENESSEAAAARGHRVILSPLELGTADDNNGTVDYSSLLQHYQRPQQRARGGGVIAKRLGRSQSADEGSTWRRNAAAASSAGSSELEAVWIRSARTPVDDTSASALATASQQQQQQQRRHHHHHHYRGCNLDEEMRRPKCRDTTGAGGGSGEASCGTRKPETARTASCGPAGDDRHRRSRDRCDDSSDSDRGGRLRHRGARQQQQQQQQLHSRNSSSMQSENALVHVSGNSRINIHRSAAASSGNSRQASIESSRSAQPQSSSASAANRKHVASGRSGQARSSSSDAFAAGSRVKTANKQQFQIRPEIPTASVGAFRSGIMPAITSDAVDVRCDYKGTSQPIQQPFQPISASALSPLQLASSTTSPPCGAADADDVTATRDSSAAVSSSGTIGFVAALRQFADLRLTPETCV